jgi:2-phospho-L-lactate/phosphoenolpyruvate guanylyltransferase
MWGLTAIKTIIPVRLTGAKSRLAPILKPEERIELTLTMLRDLLRVVREASAVTGISVVTPDERVLEVAGDFDADVILEKSVEGIDAAINKAAKLYANANGEEILILPVDIPLLAVGDVEKLASIVDKTRGMVIAPSKDGQGTNGLLLKPSTIISTKYGKDSFGLHLVEGWKAGVVPRIYRSSRIELDIDTPADLAEFILLKKDSETLRFLLERGIDHRLNELSIALRT